MIIASFFGWVEVKWNIFITLLGYFLEKLCYFLNSVIFLNSRFKHSNKLLLIFSIIVCRWILPVIFGDFYVSYSHVLFWNLCCYKQTRLFLFLYLFYRHGDPKWHKDAIDEHSVNRLVPCSAACVEGVGPWKWATPNLEGGRARCFGVGHVEFVGRHNSRVQAPPLGVDVNVAEELLRGHPKDSFWRCWEPFYPWRFQHPGQANNDQFMASMAIFVRMCSCRSVEMKRIRIYHSSVTE